VGYPGAAHGSAISAQCGCILPAHPSVHHTCASVQCIQVCASECALLKQRQSALCMGGCARSGPPHPRAWTPGIVRPLRVPALPGRCLGSQSRRGGSAGQERHLNLLWDGLRLHSEWVWQRPLCAKCPQWPPGGGTTKDELKELCARAGAGLCGT